MIVLAPRWREDGVGHAYRSRSACFTTFWTRAQRHENDREMRLLRRYRACLTERGITDYSLDQLLDDYRVSIVYMLFRTIWDQTSGASEAYWRPKLDCVVASYQDHECDSLFGR